MGDYKPVKKSELTWTDLGIPDNVNRAYDEAANEGVRLKHAPPEFIDTLIEQLATKTETRREAIHLEKMRTNVLYRAYHNARGYFSSFFK